jgi:hypothetical protein
MTDINPNWEACGESNPFTRLLATIYVNGCAMHLEAREVTLNTDEQGFVDYPEDYESLCNLYCPDGSFQTFELNGRTYLPFAVPFSQ